MATSRKPPAGGEPPAPTPSSEPVVELGPRKLIRPSLAEIRRDQGLRAPSSRKMAPPEQTNAEAFYYLKQMQARTPIVVKLLDGEEIRGWIEWYDKDVLKVNREGAPNLLVPKHAIKYLYKQEEERLQRRRERLERRGRPPAGPGTPAAE
ncbi:MAG TPA: RNA chaperone Hfq [Thermoanaerobaculia bacterium]|nr:RNA chaperone Hfq [Thermoanaerobaculia bacterium]HQR67004.1 RNA chaperone Hfq [Thermoanaerobaculia bacterium]